MRRLGAFLFWLLSEDIDYARMMKHYFYTTDAAASNRKSNKVSVLDIDQNVSSNKPSKSQEWLNMTRHDGGESFLTRMII